MRGKFLAFKLIAVFVTVLGIASAVVGALFGNTDYVSSNAEVISKECLSVGADVGSKVYIIEPSDPRNSVVWVRAALEIPEPLSSDLIKQNVIRENQLVGTGTGWAIGTPGEDVSYIVTNGHVIEHAYAWPKGEDNPFYINSEKLDNYLKKAYGKSIKDFEMKHEIRLYYSNDDYVVPEVVYYSGPSDKDIAILKLNEPTNKRTALLIRDSDQVVPGEEVTSVGYPVSDRVGEVDVSHDVKDVTYTKGIISKRVKLTGRNYEAFQCDAEINAGNSGGPLIDKNGCVVGINTLGNSQDKNMNYAIVSNEITGIMRELNISGELDTTYEEIFNRLPLKQISPLIWFLFAGIALFICGAILLIIPVGKKTPVVAADFQPGVNPYAAVQQPCQPAVQGYSWQGYSQQSYAQQAYSGQAAASLPAFAAAQASSPAATQGTLPVLKGLKGQFAGKAFNLSKGTAILGRDPANCNLMFKDNTPGISGKHCRLDYDATTGSFILNDLGSSFGTFTGNGKKLTAGVPERLMAGDTFYLADENVKFQVLIKLMM